MGSQPGKRPEDPCQPPAARVRGVQTGIAAGRAEGWPFAGKTFAYIDRAGESGCVMRRWSHLFLILFLLMGVMLLLCSGTLAEDKSLWPQTGKNVKKNGKLILDASYTQDGYFMAAVQKKNKHKLKLRVTKGRETLTYDQ